MKHGKGHSFYSTAHRGNVQIHKGHAKADKHTHTEKSATPKYEAAFYKKPAPAIEHGDTVALALQASVLIFQAAQTSNGPG